MRTRTSASLGTLTWTLVPGRLQTMLQQTAMARNGLMRPRKQAATITRKISGESKSAGIQSRNSGTQTAGHAEVGV